MRTDALMQNSFIICFMLYAIAVGQIIIISPLITGNC